MRQTRSTRTPEDRGQRCDRRQTHTACRVRRESIARRHIIGPGPHRGDSEPSADPRRGARATRYTALPSVNYAVRSDRGASPDLLSAAQFDAWNDASPLLVRSGSPPTRSRASPGALAMTPIRVTQGAHIVSNQPGITASRAFVSSPSAGRASASGSSAASIAAAWLAPTASAPGRPARRVSRAGRSRPAHLKRRSPTRRVIQDAAHAPHVRGRTDVAAACLLDMHPLGDRGAHIWTVRPNFGSPARVAVPDGELDRLDEHVRDSRTQRSEHPRRPAAEGSGNAHRGPNGAPDC